jgi:hypothetical protein
VGVYRDTVLNRIQDPLRAWVAGTEDYLSRQFNDRLRLLQKLETDTEDTCRVVLGVPAVRAGFDIDGRPCFEV